VELEEMNDAKAAWIRSAIAAVGFSRLSESGADCQCENAEAISRDEVRA
jgi:hypothetical protein